MKSILVLIFLLSASAVNSYRILGLFPHPGISHWYFFKPIMKALSEAGHEVTVVSHFPEIEPPANYKDVPLSGLTSLVDVIDLEVSECLRLFAN